MDAVAGSQAATIELEAVSSEGDPLDVGLDDIRIESAAVFPTAQIFADANDTYTVFVNGDEIGTGSRFLAGESFSARLQAGPNVIGFEVDGDEAGPRLVGSLTIGDRVVRTGNPGWKSSTIQIDGTVAQDWMMLNFDDSIWENVPVGGTPLFRTVHT